MQRSVPAPESFRSPEYDYWMAYYDKNFHNQTPQDLGKKGMKKKLALRAWLNEEQAKRREPRLIQGFLPKGHERLQRRRFRLENV